MDSHNALYLRIHQRREGPGNRQRLRQYCEGETGGIQGRVWIPLGFQKVSPENSTAGFRRRTEGLRNGNTDTRPCRSLCGQLRARQRAYTGNSGCGHAPGCRWRDPLVRFTERLRTQVVEPYFQKHAELKKPAIYVGSLPALFEPKMQQLPAVTGLIQLARNTPAITGLAIHLHLEGQQQMREAFEFVRQHLPKKPIIVPEFSLHRLYVDHLTEKLGEDDKGKAFCERFKRDPDMRLNEWYSLANQHRVSPEEWSAMFASRSWFPPHFLLTFYRYFQTYGVALATYGFLSQYAPAHVPPDGLAWFINPIFPFKSLPLNADGSYPRNPLWFDDFVSIVEKVGRKPSRRTGFDYDERSFVKRTFVCVSSLSPTLFAKRETPSRQLPP